MITHETFVKKLNQEFYDSVLNNFGLENYDEYRFGKYEGSFPNPSIHKIKNIFRKILYKNKDFVSQYYSQEMTEKLTKIYNMVDEQSRDLLMPLLVYKIYKFSKVKLPMNNHFYWDAIEKAKTLEDKNDTYDPHFIHIILSKFDLTKIGYDIKIYFSEIAIAIDYIIEQYAYKVNNKSVVEVEEGDVVLDAGGCWGDTALYFAHKSGPNGKVYSFEFIPDNIKLFKINTGLNPLLESRITLVPFPLSDQSGSQVYFKDAGPSSIVKFSSFPEQTGETTTLSIDDYIEQQKITKVDFIKMDIEGAEPAVLEGAWKTIQKFRPKLAIAIYHSLSDFVEIPLWLMEKLPDYDFYIGHYTIHAEETILFAKPKS